MNVTGSTSIAQYGKRINWQAISLAGGLAVALTAAALAGAFERETTTSITPAVARLVATTPPAVAHHTIYIVGSQEAANALNTAISTDAASTYGGELSGTASVIVIETVEQEIAFNGDLNALLQAGSSAQIRDLRHQPITTVAGAVHQGGPARITLYIVGSESEKAALEATLANDAGVQAAAPDILVIETPEQAAWLAAMVEDHQAFGTFNVIDMR